MHPYPVLAVQICLLLGTIDGWDPLWKMAVGLAGRSYALAVYAPDETIAAPEGTFLYFGVL